MTALFSVMVVVASLSDARGATIKFIHTGTGSGSVGGKSFVNAAFTMTGLGDTNDRVDLRDEFHVLLMEESSLSIAIRGVGEYQVLSGSRVFVNQDYPEVGLSRDSNEPGLFDGPIDPVFATWDMLSSIGPIASTGNIYGWIFPQVVTNAGLSAWTWRRRQRPSNA